MRLGVVTDIHRCPPGSPPDGWHNPHRFGDVRERLARSFQWLEREGVDRLAVLGDLTHFGDLRSMREVLDVLGESHLPCWVLPGNHDLNPDVSVLREALEAAGHSTIEPMGAVPTEFPPSWIAAGVGIERAADGGCQASAQPDPAGWGDAPVLFLSHFPVLSLESDVVAAGLKYAGDLVDADTIGISLQDRAAPTFVIHGHLHVRHVVARGPVLQASCGAQIESLFEATIFDFGEWDVSRISWTSAAMQEVDPGVQPVLSDRRQSWAWDGAAWRNGA